MKLNISEYFTYSYIKLHIISDIRIIFKNNRILDECIMNIKIFNTFKMIY
jgi:hypothetical protein